MKRLAQHLSPQEQNIYSDRVAGLTYKAIADKRHISLSTVKAHLGRIFVKKQVQSSLELQCHDRATRCCRKTTKLQLRQQTTDFGRWLVANAGKREESLIEAAKLFVGLVAERINMTRALGTFSPSKALQNVMLEMFSMLGATLFFTVLERDGGPLRRLALALERFADETAADPTALKLLALKEWCKNTRPTIKTLAKKMGLPDDSYNPEMLRRKAALLHVAIALPGNPRKSLHTDGLKSRE